MSHGRPAGARYDPGAFPPVGVTVDMAVFTIADRLLQVLLIQREADPYAGAWALPGGFVRPDETLDDAAARELYEETAVTAAGHLEQVRAYGDPGRDPRLRVVTVAYLAVLPRMPAIAAGSDAHGAALVPVDEIVGAHALGSHRLAFDHERILGDAVERARSKLETTPLATAFVSEEFTLAELRQVYEAAWGRPLDPAAFRSAVLATPGFVVPAGHRSSPDGAGGGPVQMYRTGDAVRLDPPLRRPVAGL